MTHLFMNIWYISLHEMQNIMMAQMNYEIERFGKPLSVSTRTSDNFWENEGVEMIRKKEPKENV